MYGLIGKMTTVAGKREEVLAALLEGINDMPGCLSYIVAKDTKDPNAIWITEVWDSEASHKASLSLPEVRAAIARARPIIAGFGESFTTAPVGGIGLKPQPSKQT
jgi:quinol monooxygenase YgiN